LHELNADEHDGGTGDEGREDLPKHAGRREGHADCEEGAACCGTKDCAVSLGTRHFLPSGGGWTVPGLVHLA
jgi:hypothetical protein